MKETYILSAPSAEDSIITVSYHKKRQTISHDEEQGLNPATFETAMSATGFGKYNIILLFVTLPSALASICATTSISFILSDAQCDLDLSLEDKGMLNAITYIGMICSAFLWGMIGDSFGRRTVLLYSYGFDAIIGFMGALSRTKWVLMCAKFSSGFVMSGPVAVFMCYVSEFHCTSFRPKLITILGVYYSIARTMLPLLAWWILPQKLHVIFIEGFIEYKSWQIYLLVNCIPSVLAALAHFYFPETPKFLMTKGRYDEALEIFRRIYAKNTGNPPETFPIKQLIDTTFKSKNNEQNNIDTKSKTAAILDLLNNVKPLFFPPYLFKTFLMCGIMFGGLLGGNTLRLWLPQLFTTMDNYLLSHNDSDASTLCDMLDYSPKTTHFTNLTVPEICITPEVSDEVYINNIIVPISSIIGYFVIAAIVSTIGKKSLLVFQYVVSGLLIIGNYWSTNTITTVILTSLYLTFFSICATTATGIAVELFPTNMRTMATSIFLLCGRVGSILGNTLFPVLLLTGCLPPFIFIGGFMFLCAIFALMLPGTENKPLK